MKIAFSAGEYDDYYIIIYCFVPSITWVKTKLQEWANENPKQWEKFTFSQMKFIDWLLSHEECVQTNTDFTELHLGSYHLNEVEEAIRPTRKI